MSKRAFAAVAAAVALFSTAASAADVDRYSTSYSKLPQVGYWQGPYVGANLGYQWGSVSNVHNNPSGVMGGIQGGYGWQFGQFVVGGETDFQITDADDRFAPWKFSNPWFGTLRARAGVTMNSLLFYGTVGLAYGSLRTENIISGVSESHVTTGWAGGGGIEMALTANWSARAEYLYVDLGEQSFALTGAAHSMSSNILRFGINYRF